MTSFTDLQVWKVGLILVKQVYLLTKEFPPSEMYGLISQLRRAATSIMANLAEGFSRYSSADKAHKYTISRGECAEVHALLLISKELGYINAENAENCIQLSLETGKLLSGLIRSYSPPSPSPNPNPPVL